MGQSAPLVPQQQAVPIVPPQPVQPPAAEQVGAAPQGPIPAPIVNPAPVVAQPQRRFANLFQPLVAFRLFMFYYLFCSPTLPEWQRSLFMGALVLYYLFTVDVLGYFCPTWRARRRAAPGADLDIIEQGPNDADGDEPNARPNNGPGPPRPLTKRQLVEFFVVGLFASLLPSWNYATMVRR